ncbi:MAG: hypothetical protein K2X01_08435 [Cyanobacteria bacterium]|nr:hypothetical protein [Cyanobacteriota bacterium]
MSARDHNINPGIPKESRSSSVAIGLLSALRQPHDNDEWLEGDWANAVSAELLPPMQPYPAITNKPEPVFSVWDNPMVTEPMSFAELLEPVPLQPAASERESLTSFQRLSLRIQETQGLPVSRPPEFQSHTLHSLEAPAEAAVVLPFIGKSQPDPGIRDEAIHHELDALFPDGAPERIDAFLVNQQKRGGSRPSAVVKPEAVVLETPPLLDWGTVDDENPIEVAELPTDLQDLSHSLQAQVDALDSLIRESLSLEQDLETDKALVEMFEATPLPQAVFSPDQPYPDFADPADLLQFDTALFGDLGAKSDLSDTLTLDLRNEAPTLSESDAITSDETAPDASSGPSDIEISQWLQQMLQRVGATPNSVPSSVSVNNAVSGGCMQDLSGYKDLSKPPVFSANGDVEYSEGVGSVSPISSQATFATRPEPTHFSSNHGEVAFSGIDNQRPDVEAEFTNNVRTLIRLVNDLPEGVTKQTGAQIIRLTMEAMGISMEDVLSEAQSAQSEMLDAVRSNIKKIEEYKTVIRKLESDIKFYQGRANELSEIIDLFILSNASTKVSGVEGYSS